jgi:hypothetical protein
LVITGNREEKASPGWFILTKRENTVAKGEVQQEREARGTDLRLGTFLTKENCLRWNP